jgi:hypothetical protein
MRDYPDGAGELLIRRGVGIVYNDTTSNRSDLIRFESNTYPGVADRWDAVRIVYKIGKHADSTTVDAWSKSAMLLLVGHYDANREMLVPDNMASMVAYERICKLRHRGTYP